MAELHRAIDARVVTLHVLHAGRLQCRRGCHGCCVDGLSVFEIEADAIRSRHAELLEHGRPHPEGACAFLDEEGACRIYSARPYVCRTQGLPLRWIDDDDGDGVERRDICELNDSPAGGPWPEITQLPAEQCWTIGPAELELQELQRAQGRPLARVKLRDLFR